ncbi:MAG: hypothetical protein OEW67_07855 [Cyclobacteriaceae bacterium]|nr:hypothetical protein [Cyclobacteriaceae bacterium]
MKLKYTSALTIMLISLNFFIQAQDTPSNEQQIVGALQAAPEDDREGATVLGYNASGKLITLKKGTNSMICIADNPKQEGFNSACYHKDLEPFMVRGRELKAQGKDHGEVFKIREQEAKDGKLKMPKEGATLHVLSGPDGKYNPSSNTIDNVTLRYVIYIPWATSESTGLPIRPIVPGGPWIMDPGTHRAHIMISPPPSMQK